MWFPHKASEANNAIPIANNIVAIDFCDATFSEAKGGMQSLLEVTLDTYEQLKQWCQSYLLKADVDIWTAVRSRIHELWYDRLSLEKLSKLKFIEIFKEEPLIKYYFLRSLWFVRDKKFFCKNDIVKQDIANFIDKAGIEYLSDEQYISLAKQDLASFGINSHLAFMSSDLRHESSLISSLGFQAVLKKFDIPWIDSINGDKQALANYLFWEDNNQIFIDEILEELNQYQISNFTDLLMFVSFEESWGNTRLSSITGNLSLGARKYLVKQGISGARIRWSKDVMKLAEVTQLLPTHIGVYKSWLINKIKEQPVLWKIEFRWELTKKVIKKMAVFNNFFNIYFYFFVNWKIRSLNDENIETINLDLWLIDSELLSDQQMKQKVLDKYSIAEINQGDKKSFIWRYKDSFLVKEYVTRVTWNREFSKLKLDEYDMVLSRINDSA